MSNIVAVIIKVEREFIGSIFFNCENVFGYSVRECQDRLSYILFTTFFALKEINEVSRLTCKVAVYTVLPSIKFAFYSSICSKHWAKFARSPIAFGDIALYCCNFSHRGCFDLSAGTWRLKFW